MYDRHIVQIELKCNGSNSLVIGLDLFQSDSAKNETLMTNIRLHKGDISTKAAARYKGDIAIDTETLGLLPRRDRLCVVQLSPGDGTADVIQIAKSQKEAPNLVAIL